MGLFVWVYGDHVARAWSGGHAKTLELSMARVDPFCPPDEPPGQYEGPPRGPKHPPVPHHHPPNRSGTTTLRYGMAARGRWWDFAGIDVESHRTGDPGRSGHDPPKSVLPGPPHHQHSR